MRLIHSFWTAPMHGERWGISGQLTTNIWLFAMSVACAKRAGAEIVLHTDDEGKEYIGFLPYDEVHTTLNELNVNTRFWASGKLLAMKNEPLGAVHIDGDVFINKPMLDFMQSGKWDIIAQNKEIARDGEKGFYGRNHKKILLSLSVIPKEFYLVNFALNCGTVGFRDKFLKDRYIFCFENLLNNLNASEHYLSQLEEDSTLCPNIVIEQQLLGSLAEWYEADVKYIFNGNSYQDHKTSRELGYIHLIGQQKYSETERIKSTLKQVNPDIYNLVEQKLSKWKI